MKQKLINWFISGLIGFLGCLWFTDKGCVYVPEKSKIINNTWIEHHTDTLLDTVVLRVPVPVVKYVEREVPKWMVIQDSVYSDSGQLMVPYNVYIDSVETDKYKFSYSAEVMGELVSLNPQITLYTDSTSTIQEEQVFIPKIPDWSLTVGLSDKLNFYTGVGYKGWSLGVDFNNRQFNQVFLTKTFTIK